MRAWLLVCALAACDSDHGRALDLTFTGACGADRYQVQITTVPPTTLAGGGNSATVGGSELVALLPDDTSHADIQVTAFAGDSAVASAMISVDFSGPGEISRAIAFDSCADLAAGGDLSLDLAGADLASSDLASNDLAIPPPDLIGPDFSGVDLEGAVLVTGISVGGAFGPSVYEAEGSASPTGGGIALLAVGVGLDTIGTITASGGVTVDTPVHSTDGTQLAASLHLPVDNANGASAAPQSVQLTFGSGASPPTASFTYVPLDEKASGGTLATNGTPLMYSTVNVNSTLTLSGPSGPAFLVATGSFTAGSLTASTAAGGYPGCSGTCSAANGPGFGMPGGGNGGGGAGYAATGGGGGSGGAVYGDPSVIGLPGGSGGGPGNVAGGNGGAVLRILAGSLSLSGTVSVDGDSGQSAAGLALGQSGGGGGSGGTILLQSRSTLSLGQVHAQGGGGGGGAVAGNSGFGGAAGRIRVDVALPQSIGGTITPAVGYLGAAISADFATAQQSAGLSSIEVVCGSSTQVQISVDGAMRGSGTCDAITSGGRKTIAISPPLAADGAIHYVCARSLPASATFSASPRYAAPFAEDTSCRSLVVVN